MRPIPGTVTDPNLSHLWAPTLPPIIDDDPGDENDYQRPVDLFWDTEPDFDPDEENALVHWDTLSQGDEILSALAATFRRIYEPEGAFN